MMYHIESGLGCPEFDLPAGSRKQVFFYDGAFFPGYGDIDKPDRLLSTAAARTGNAGDADAEAGADAAPHPLSHLPGHRL